MRLKRHSVWSVYGDKASNLNAYVQNFVPSMSLRREVSKDVFKSFEVIKSLVVHGYYEYEFIDVAVAKLLQTFEMALKIRYLEINDKEWPKNKSLAKLIEWFRLGGYFEVSEKAILDHVRNARNVFSHPKNHFFGGIALFHWFDTITDLINDIHADPSNRKKRIAEIETINKKIREIIKDGGKIHLGFKSDLIYEAGVLFVEEIEGKSNYLFCYKSPFSLDKTGRLISEQVFPLQLIELGSFEFKFSSNKCEFGFFNIQKPKIETEAKSIRLFIDKINKNHLYFAYNNHLDYEIQKIVEKKRREALHSKFFIGFDPCC